MIPELIIHAFPNWHTGAQGHDTVSQYWGPRVQEHIDILPLSLELLRATSCRTLRNLIRDGRGAGKNRRTGSTADAVSRKGAATEHLHSL